jgi:hypothetical protein
MFPPSPYNLPLCELLWVPLEKVLAKNDHVLFYSSGDANREIFDETMDVCGLCHPARGHMVALARGRATGGPARCGRRDNF